MEKQNVLLITTLILTQPISMATMIDLAWWCIKKGYNVVQWVAYGSEKSQEEKLLVANKAQLVQLQDNIALLMKEVKKLDETIQHINNNNENFIEQQ